MYDFEPDVFNVVNQMYCAYRALNPQVRRTWYINGELAECPLDYIISVDLAVKRSTLTLREKVLWSRFSQENAEVVAKLLPASTKEKLAEAWKPVYWGYPSLRAKSEHGSAMERAKEQRKAKALDDGAFALYAEEREAIEILQQDSETQSGIAAEGNTECQTK
jgi:hypothetical protein